MSEAKKRSEQHLIDQAGQQLLRSKLPSHWVLREYAPCRGIFEPRVEIGDSVHPGQCAGAIHPIDGPHRPPQAINFTRPGLVACRRFPALTNPGDCLFKLLSDVERP